MAETILQNMKDPSQTVTAMVTIRRDTVVGMGSAPVWIIEASTDQRTAAGELVPPVRRWTSNRDTFTEDVNDILLELTEYLEWNNPEDVDPPKIATHWPLSGETNVSVETAIIVNITEELPSSGIDMSTIKIKVKGFDVTDQATIEGDLRSCSVRYTPGTKYKSAIDPNFNWSAIEVVDES